jgi:hypothetical protein
MLTTEGNARPVPPPHQPSSQQHSSIICRERSGRGQPEKYPLLNTRSHWSHFGNYLCLELRVCSNICQIRTMSGSLTVYPLTTRVCGQTGACCQAPNSIALSFDPLVFGGIRRVCFLRNYILVCSPFTYISHPFAVICSQLAHLAEPPAIAIPSSTTSNIGGSASRAFDLEMFSGDAHIVSHSSHITTRV